MRPAACSRMSTCRFPRCSSSSASLDDSGRADGISPCMHAGLRQPEGANTKSQRGFSLSPRMVLTSFAEIPAAALGQAAKLKHVSV